MLFSCIQFRYRLHKHAKCPLSRSDECAINCEQKIYLIDHSHMLIVTLSISTYFFSVLYHLLQTFFLPFPKKFDTTITDLLSYHFIIITSPSSLINYYSMKPLQPSFFMSLSLENSRLPKRFWYISRI